MHDKPSYPRNNPGLVARDVLLAFIAISGFAYFNYKFGNPEFGNNDFFRYKEMVLHPFDLSATSAPFVLRQLPTFVAHIFYMSGLSYDTKVNFDVVLAADNISKRIFFALILSNAAAIALSIVAAMNFIRKRTSDSDTIVFFSYVGILFSYFYFPISMVAPLTFGWGWLATVILAVALLEKRVLLVIFGCLVALTTRETVLVFMLVFSFLSWAIFRPRERFYLDAAAILAASCGVLVLTRTYLVHGYEGQFDLYLIASNILAFRPSTEFVIQAIVPQALILVLLAAVGVRDRRCAIALFAGVLAIVLIGIGTNERPGGIGRVIGETLPLYAIIFLLSRVGGLPVHQREREGLSSL